MHLPVLLECELGISTTFAADFLPSTAPILFGPMVDWVLYGVLCVQTSLTGADVYYWFMAGFGDVDGLKSLGFPHRLPDLDAIISLIVKVSAFPSVFSGLLQQISVIQATGALWGGLKACCYLESEASLIVKPSLYPWLITSAVVDILIAVTMTFPNVNWPSDWPSLIAKATTVSFALYIGFPNDIYYACPYSNTLLVTLNNRIYFRDHPFLGDRVILACLGPSSRSAHNLPQVTPPGIVTANGR
ncbi:hypothetical protein BJV77DRAFT_963665 [Russula vinacea]|nr:hypothetical protein BJV77DRAFT_963665 [Russula vinacea]